MLHKASVVWYNLHMRSANRRRSADKRLIWEWLVWRGKLAPASSARNGQKRGIPGSCARVWSAAWRPPPAGWRRSSARPHCRGRRRRWSARWCRPGPARRSRPAPAAGSRSCRVKRASLQLLFYLKRLVPFYGSVIQDWRRTQTGVAVTNSEKLIPRSNTSMWWTIIAARAGLALCFVLWEVKLGSCPYKD